MIERRRIWTDEALADYVRDELGFPGARQGVMVEKERVDTATGEVNRERWYLLTSLSSRQVRTKGTAPGDPQPLECGEQPASRQRPQLG